ncbi:MAG TPA: response regulator [Longimicrobium sp.]|nr:response regulator [Longimicrobium sp.]
MAPPQTVLLVDTHEDSRAIYRIILEHHGFAVLLAARCAEAPTVARERRPDLVILELGLTREHALDALRALRGHAATAEVPVVALGTGFSAAERELALAAGFDAYLLKPLPPLELLEAARGLLDGRTRRAAG